MDENHVRTFATNFTNLTNNS